MQYADYEYYQTEYGGKMSVDDYKRFGRRAERRIDGITGNKLQFAFPTNERDVEAVKDCVCELADFLYQIDSYSAAAMESMGTVAQADGTVKGKVITSISSGSESIGYSASGSVSTATMEAAKDKKVSDTMVYGIVRDFLGGVPDSNGVNFLYAGIPYPVRNAPISRPPEEKPVERPEEPTGPQDPDKNKDTVSKSYLETDAKNTDDSGIGYVDSVVVYNRYINGLMETETYFGTRFDNVRVELTQGANQKASGMENASVCVVKIKNANFPKPYKAPEIWNDLTTEEMLESFTLDAEGKNFFVIIKKAELGIDIDVPVGRIEQDETKYPGGFFEYIKTKYGYAFSVDTVDVYTLIPRFEIGRR